MIQLDRVFKFYRTGKHVKIVLDHISTVFQSGRSYGLLGVNGAGKSTTIRLIHDHAAVLDCAVRIKQFSTNGSHVLLHDIGRNPPQP